MYDDAWVPLTLQADIANSIDAWQSYDGPSVGWCFVCDCPIKSAEDMIEGTNNHRCETQIKGS